MEEEYERIILVKPEVFVYKIPPRTTNRGVRAADWKLDCPDWTGRLRLVAKGKECFLKLEDKITGELFAKSPIDKYPGIAIEAVSDSSRYFVVRLQDDDGRSAFIGIGFADRGDSFDVNVALQDHFKWLQKNEEIEKEATKPESSQPQLDLGFKEGQTITINMNIAKKSGSSKNKSKANAGTAGGLGFGLLPPPPGSHKVPGPPSAKNSPPAPSPTSAESTSILPAPPASSETVQSAVDLLGLLDLSSNPESEAAAPTVPASSATATNGQNVDLWGDFAAAGQNPPSAAASTTPAQNWVQF